MKIMGFDTTVVKERQREKWWITFDHTCQSCGAVLRLDGRDRVEVTENGRFAAFTCPNCGATVEVRRRPRRERQRPNPPTTRPPDLPIVEPHPGPGYPHGH